MKWIVKWKINRNENDKNEKWNEEIKWRNKYYKNDEEEEVMKW